MDLRVVGVCTWGWLPSGHKRKAGRDSMAFSDSALAYEAICLLYSMEHKCIIKGGQSPE